MQKSKSGKVNNSCSNKDSSNQIHSPLPNNQQKNKSKSPRMKLESKVVEPKKVDSNYFDSEDENQNNSQIKDSLLENKSTEKFSQIMAKLRSKHNLKFQSESQSILSSNISEVQNTERSRPVNLKSTYTSNQKGMSGLLKNLFKEMSAGEKICKETYAKVNKQNEVI